MMRPLIRAAAALSILAALAGCASAKVASRQAYDGATLPRPDRILVEGFGATPGDVPPGSGLGAQGRILRTGREPVNLSLQAFDVERPRYGPDRSERFQVQLLFPR